MSDTHSREEHVQPFDPHPLLLKVGEVLRTAREAKQRAHGDTKRFSQKAVAAQLGVGRDAVLDLEKHGTVTSIVTILHYAWLMAIPPHALFLATSDTSLGRLVGLLAALPAEVHEGFIATLCAMDATLPKTAGLPSSAVAPS